MNARAIQLVGRSRGLIAQYPGAVSIQCNASRTWTTVTIGTATDDAVFQLALLFDLKPPKERRAEREQGGTRWYLAATAERRDRDRTLVQVTVVGPHHIEESAA
jgi:hypothetical protein